MISTNEMTKRPEGGVLALYDDEQLSVIRNHVAAPDFTNDELAYCLSVARARGLDPLQKQVYFSKRKKKDARGNFVAAVTVEPTIDGFRAMAERTNELDGYDGPYWCGPDGVWSDVWLVNTPPVACKISVFRSGKSRPFTAVARYESYMQGYDGKPNPIWAKMADNMLAKCAESLALRRAFPSHLGELYTREEMGQEDNIDRFAQLPREQKDEPKVQVNAAPKPLNLPPIPDTVTTIPLELCRGVFKPLAAFDGTSLQVLTPSDLELIVSTVSDNRQRVHDEAARAWLLAIEATATECLRDASIDNMDAPPLEHE